MAALLVSDRIPLCGLPLFRPFHWFQITLYWHFAQIGAVDEFGSGLMATQPVWLAWKNCVVLPLGV
jgi:hypothetical protein